MHVLPSGSGYFVDKKEFIEWMMEMRTPDSAVLVELGFKTEDQLDREIIDYLNDCLNYFLNN